MQASRAIAPLALLQGALGDQVQVNPIGQVLSLVDELIAKVNADGESEAKAYAEYLEWCDDVTKNTGFAIKTAESDKAKLGAKIAELTSDISVADSKVEELGGAISAADKELKDATAIRAKETKDFAASEAELMEAISALSRAINILEKEMAKNPASLAQMNNKNLAGTVQALSAVLSAASINSADQKTLLGFVQSQQSDDADDSEFGAPAAAAYKGQSGNILDVLEDMKEKAEGQLSDLRKAEVTTKHNFEMVKQSLEDQMAADQKDMDDEKAGKASAQEAKATAEGDLKVTVKQLESSEQQLSTSRSTCIQVAADHEATVAGRKEELKALDDAKKILVESTSGATAQTYSFFQFGSVSNEGLRLHTRADLVGSEVVVAVKRLAKEQHSAALSQLASRIATVLRFGNSAQEDPFAKVKGLIQDMIAKLSKEADSDASEKAFCDEQMSKTEEKKSELEDDITKMTSKIDQAVAKSAQLKEDVQELETQLSALAKEQAEMDKIRRDTHQSYTEAKADLELGLTGVRKALGVLRDYYGASSAMLQADANIGTFMQQPSPPETHSKSSGAGGGIIDILEVCEADFAKNLAKEESAEADAQSEYEKVSQENKITKTTAEQDVKYKTQESKSLDKTTAEYSQDRQTANSELSAVLEYYAKIKDRCIAKPEAYSERKARREAEIAGLKQALSILEDETALVQRKGHKRFRGSLAA